MQKASTTLTKPNNLLSSYAQICIQITHVEDHFYKKKEKKRKKKKAFMSVPLQQQHHSSSASLDPSNKYWKAKSLATTTKPLRSSEPTSKQSRTSPPSSTSCRKDNTTSLNGPCTHLRIPSNTSPATHKTSPPPKKTKPLTDRENASSSLLRSDVTAESTRL